ncbi:hypothetical protein ES703_93602 [subsurface metagenome]
MAHGETSITVPEDSVLRTRQATVNITIPTLKAGRYDLYAKVDGEQSSPVLGRVHVVEVVSLPPEAPPVVPEVPVEATRIVDWHYPGSAKAGEIITLTATIVNYHDQALVAKVEGELLGHTIRFNPSSFSIGAGGIWVYTSAGFSMPNRDIIVKLTSFHQEGTAWIEDDSTELEILLETEIPEVPRRWE